MSIDIVDDALIFATLAHTGAKQRRKYTDEPYIVHPIEVMMIVRSVPHTPEMLAAALLHDTVEDTDVTIEDIEATYGETVAALVNDLTEPDWPGNRAERKEAEAQRLATISPEAQTIKLADLISNTSTIVQHDPDFARVYLREKRRILGLMSAGDAKLYERAFMAIFDGIARVGG